MNKKLREKRDARDKKDTRLVDSLRSAWLGRWDLTGLHNKKWRERKKKLKKGGVRGESDK